MTRFVASSTGAIRSNIRRTPSAGNVPVPRPAGSVEPTPVIAPSLRERVLEAELVERAADDEVDEILHGLGAVVKARREEEDRRARLAERRACCAGRSPRAASRAA